MNKIFKLLCLCSVVTIISSIFISVPVNAADSKKMVFLYAGKLNATREYSTYSAANLSKLTNVNEFVINSAGGGYGAYGDGGDSHYGDLANSMVACVNNVLSVKSNSKFWICIPPVDPEPYNGSAFDYASYYTPIFKAYMQNVKSQLSTSVWDNNIAGFYFSTEQIFFDISNPNNAAGTNTQVKLMSDLSSYIRSSAEINNSGAVKKKFLWSPFIGKIMSTEYYINKVATVTNKTNIFDYVLLQPGYYFNQEKNINLGAIYMSCNKQCLVYPDESYPEYHGVTLSKTSGVNTQFGVQLEIDGKYFSNDYPDSEYKYRYDNVGNPFADESLNYVNAFNTIKNKYPMSFYCGDVSSPFVKVNDFFKNGIKGDLNSDGKVNSIDTLLMKNYILGTATNINIENADMNYDGKIGAVDNLMLKKYILFGLN